MDNFNEAVRRVANLRAYGEPVEGYDPMIVVAADMYLSYAPFDMPERGPEPPATVSGEFTAR